MNRLERLLDRLERTVLARELNFASEALSFKPDDNLEKACTKSVDLAVPTFAEKLEQRISELEADLDKRDGAEFDIIPTVVAQIFKAPAANNNNNTMSVNGYEDIILGYLNPFLDLSKKIGGDVAVQAELVQKAFAAQFEYIKLATTIAQPPANKQQELLKPTSDQISAIQSLREKNRTSPFFNHLSAISESIPALGWVCVSPTPGPHVKEMNDAGQFYTNRVLKDWKEKDPKHAEWARGWVQVLSELQKFIKQYHTTGLVWSGKGQASSGGPPPPPPPGMPPPPPVIPLDALSIDDSGDTRNALFAAINKGADITKGLKKVTADMQTHKNTTLRSGPAPFVTPQPFKAGGAPAIAPKPVQAKPPVFMQDGKKWKIEYQKGNNDMKIEGAQMNNVVYMFKCENSTLKVDGKINSIVIDNCKKCSILFESLVSSIEFVDCQNIQMQVLGKVPTISIDKSDGFEIYLSKDSLDVEIVSAKSSAMNVLIPTASGDFTEKPIPEQFKTTIKGTTLTTICVESLG